VAPEQASLETRWDHRVDIFAAGIILYELLTTQKPFPRATDVDSLILSRKAKVVPVTSIDPRLPRDLDTILGKALAYDPAKRYADARTFAQALVEVLFPTPHSSISDHLAQQLHQVFADRITRQRQARAHDVLIMKVLSNLAVRQPEEQRLAAAPNLTPPPGAEGLPTIEPVAVASEPQAREPKTPAPARPAHRPVVVRRGVAWSAVLLVALLSAAAGAAASWYGAPLVRPGTVLVTSDPPGAEIALDGVPTGQKTPAVLEHVLLSRPHEVTLSGPTLRPSVTHLKAEPGQLSARVHVQLGSSIGALVISSEPAGAEVLFDDRPAGQTPVTIEGVRLDQRHRIDLKLAGHEIDQVVVLPEKDGTTVKRTLTRAQAPATKK
jgi:hypothetical protein